LPETTQDVPSPSSSSDVASIPVHAYVTLFTAVVALSSIGPSLDLQHGVAPVLKIFWRMTGTWMTLLPIAAHSIYKDGWPLLSRRQVLMFICGSLCYSVVCVAFVVALEFTSVGNTVIFSNTHALLLLVGRSLVGSPVSSGEVVGALVAFSGGIFCTYDAATEEPTEAHPANLMDEAVTPILVGCWGDFIALISALGGVGYLVLASQVRTRFPSVYVYVFLNMIAASIFTLAAILCMGEEIELSRDIHIGLLGFMNTRFDRLPLEMFMVIVCNLTGAMGYVKAMQYFDNIIISVVTLLEPVVASGLAFLVGVGVMPGFWGWVGNLLVAIGTVMVINPPSQKKQSSLH